MESVARCPDDKLGLCLARGQFLDGRMQGIDRPEDEFVQIVNREGMGGRMEMAGDDGFAIPVKQMKGVYRHVFSGERISCRRGEGLVVAVVEADPVVTLFIIYNIQQQRLNSLTGQWQHSWQSDALGQPVPDDVLPQQVSVSPQ